ncbi:uncharacterized protein FTOL_11063 [Fusarium torulosum]|uniref:Uncharacterized protein n=1 Tax=Fusarium torulosum TaxID=33205 RepID=A0AAE8MIC0_9HYPO|nr:uncharacterized protein FTOL_11063 [Fusarium torulosum]
MLFAVGMTFGPLVLIAQSLWTHIYAARPARVIHTLNYALTKVIPFVIRWISAMAFITMPAIQGLLKLP